ncbi:hypothetical protein COLO4_15953 [Corchorus olitorius]|uniref:F-box domain-containing protein n=1 Tax=Corchorus olitorius TaxID=93759 RepID=A0A1R3JKH7_9ROSI|nr:hypothetical protein COLO4_15953 [Corchorus olitorius]
MSGLSNSIPDEICIEILERLPVKSLLRFKATCKPWKSLISHPSFVDHHLNRSAARCKKLVIFEELEDNSLVQLLDFGSTTNGEPTTMEFPSTIPSKLRNEFGGRYLFRCSTWGGLLLLGSDSVDGEFSILLCNPSTRQIRKIRNSPNYKHHNFHHALALGYDFTVQSYMVVTIGQRFGFSYSSPYEIAPSENSDMMVTLP